MVNKELAPIENIYHVSFDSNKMRIEFPLSDNSYELFGAKITQIWLNIGWILDGDIYTDYRINKVIVNLRKL